MWLIIECPVGEEVARRQLPEDYVLDEDIYATQYADMIGVSLATNDGYIPDCCGDLRIEFREDPDNTVHIWSGQSYYFAEE